MDAKEDTPQVQSVPRGQMILDPQADGTSLALLCLSYKLSDQAQEISSFLFVPLLLCPLVALQQGQQPSLYCITPRQFS